MTLTHLRRATAVSAGLLVTGALLGGVLLPLISWTALRHVSFGRLLVETSLGTAIGAGIAIVSDGMANPFIALVGGVLGFAASVMHLRLWRPRRRERDMVP